MAAFDTYATLQTTALNWANRQGDTDLVARIPDIIKLVEPQIDALLRRTTARATIQVAAFATALPADCKEVRSLRLTGTDPSASPPLNIVTMDMISSYASMESSGGRPVWAAIQGSTLYVSPPPDSTYPVELTYFTKLAPLDGGANQTNVVLQNAPNVYLFGILKEMAPYLENNPEASMWEQKFKEAIEQQNETREREEFLASFRPAFLPVVFSA